MCSAMQWAVVLLLAAAISICVSAYNPLDLEGPALTKSETDWLVPLIRLGDENKEVKFFTKERVMVAFNAWKDDKQIMVTVTFTPILRLLPKAYDQPSILEYIALETLRETGSRCGYIKTEGHHFACFDYPDATLGRQLGLKKAPKPEKVKTTVVPEPVKSRSVSGTRSSASVSALQSSPQLDAQKSSALRMQRWNLVFQDEHKLYSCYYGLKKTEIVESPTEGIGEIKIYRPSQILGVDLEASVPYVVEETYKKESWRPKVIKRLHLGTSKKTSSKRNTTEMEPLVEVPGSVNAALDRTADTATTIDDQGTVDTTSRTATAPVAASTTAAELPGATKKGAAKKGSANGNLYFVSKLTFVSTAVESKWGSVRDAAFERR